MDEYLFYPYRADGIALSFEAMRLPSDEDARVRAERVLEEHATATSIVVWQGDRVLHRLARPISPGGHSIGRGSRAAQSP